MDVAKQVAYWKRGAEEDLDVADELVKGDRIRHGLFFAHLAVEKALKAHVCRKTGDFAPKIHNLPRLLGLTGLQATQEQEDVLADLNPFNIEGRYAAAMPTALPRAMADDLMARAKDVMTWLIQLL